MGQWGWDHMGGGGFGGGVGGLLMLLLLVGAVVAVVALVRGFTGSAGGGMPHEKSPLDVLKERYARGDIGRDEFEQKKRDLQ